jgi:hypothetical protein
MPRDADKQREVERAIEEALRAAGETRIPRRVANSVIDRIPERVGPPPTRVPDSWSMYEDTVLPTVNHFLHDARRILRTWTRDPLVLCCLIRNLAAIGNLDRYLRETNARAKNKAFDALRQIQSLLDFLIEAFQRDISSRLDDSMDFVRFFLVAVVGAMVTTLDILRAHIDDKIFKALNFHQNTVVGRCLPFSQVISLITRAVQDPVNGLLAKLSNYITDYTNHVRQEIHNKYNCGELETNRDAQRSLSARDATLDAEADAILSPGQSIIEAGEGTDRSDRFVEIDQERKSIKQQLEAIKSKVLLSDNDLISDPERRAACWLRKMEFLQKLRFYRNLVALVIAGLDSGILCATTTSEEIIATPNPLDELGIGGPTPFRNPVKSPFPDEGWNPYPTDDELIRFLDDGFKDDPVAKSIIDNLRSGGDKDGPPATGDPGVDDSDEGKRLSNKELAIQIEAIELLADCTDVMDDDAILSVATTLQSLER